jgi:probable HAF family extracellular repeat protein
VKSSTLVLISATLLLTTLAAPIRLAAQEHARYKLIDLGTFGGPQSYVYIPDNYASVFNDRDTVAGWADTSELDPYRPDFCFNEDCFVSHAFQSHNGVRTDLGVLPHGSSSLADWISANGLIAGISQNGESDPIVPGFPEFRAVFWKDGQITDLGTLPGGGYESLANAINSHGVVVGMATNTNKDDPNSIFGFGLQTRAFRWDKENGMQDLGALGTGSDAEALLVNERGQIVGESYTNSKKSAYCNQYFGLVLATGAFLWENGEMKNLGSFGGTCTFAADLNDKGQVVGLSTLKDDKFQHAFLWENDSFHDLPNTTGGKNAAAIALNNDGVAVGWVSPSSKLLPQLAALWKNDTMELLGSVDGDLCSNAYSINASEQVVGVSAPACDFGQQRAFLWEQGSIADLNTLIPAGSHLYLTTPETINDRGEIAGIGLDSAGNDHAFLLIPCGNDDDACQDAAGSTEIVRPVPAIQPLQTEGADPVRQILRHRLNFGRFAGSPKKATSDAAGTSGPIATLSPTSLTFSPQAIGTTSAAKAVTLKNTGTSNLAISHIAVSGADAGNFAQTHTCVSTLAAGKSCSISVTFKPRVLGTSTAALSVTDNAVGSPQKVSLTGIGTTAKLSPTKLSFGTVAIGNASLPQTVTLSNVGTTTLTLGDIAVTGTDAADFAQTHTCGSSLAAGASCSISVRFKPKASGTRTAALSVTDSAAGSPQSVSMSGTGVAGRCTPQEMECAPQFPPCCPGLVCVPASTRAFCEPGSSENTSRVSSFWDRVYANKLE